MHTKGMHCAEKELDLEREREREKEREKESTCNHIFSTDFFILDSF